MVKVIGNFKENKMDIGLDHYSSPLFTQSYLSECDVDLVKKALKKQGTSHFNEIIL